MNWQPLVSSTFLSALLTAVGLRVTLLSSRLISVISLILYVFVASVNSSSFLVMSSAVRVDQYYFNKVVSTLAKSRWARSHLIWNAVDISGLWVVTFACRPRGVVPRSTCWVMMFAW